MNIYISGISGSGMGPLALMAKSVGLNIFGSDLTAGPIADELKKLNINFQIGEQTKAQISKIHQENPIDWFVYTSALPPSHPELQFAREQQIKISKRDEFIAFLVEKLNLKMVAIAGTHGKTTTTSMIIWVALKLKLPISYLVGTTLGFAQSGNYDKKARFFIYEADEYDRNFLHFTPWLSVITSISYDHADIYQTKAEYMEAFEQFKRQSQNLISDLGYIDSRITLSGSYRRKDATLALTAIKAIINNQNIQHDEQDIIKILNAFPGVGRRFECLKDGIYSDYAHHPEEISATLELAQEESKKLNKKGVIAVYEPHQNTRQHEVFDLYQDSFINADKIFWLPTYLTREDETLKVIQPNDFIKTLKNSSSAISAEKNKTLLGTLKKYRQDGFLILLMSAGSADTWLRQNLHML